MGNEFMIHVLHAMLSASRQTGAIPPEKEVGCPDLKKERRPKVLHQLQWHYTVLCARQNARLPAADMISISSVKFSEA